MSTHVLPQIAHLDIDVQREILKKLADPWHSLPRYGTVMDQQDSRITRYDPDRLTDLFQATLLDYVSAPPRTESGQTIWLNALGPRQSGKSLVSELAFYSKAAYNAGWDHVCIADHKDRAKYLHQRVQINDQYWPEDIKVPTMAHNETQKLSFAHGGQMRVLSGKGSAAGIGQSPDSLHGSEMAFWDDAAAQWTMLQPSMVNRTNSLVILECTPAPRSAPSVEWWRETYEAGVARKGRFRSVFFPFWDSKLSRRPWSADEVLTLEEQRLLDKFWDQGLRHENLAFRREMIDMDQAIRRDPELFFTWFPTDDLSCWGSSGESVIREDHFSHRDHRLVEANGKDYQEFKEPDPAAVYVIGVDAAGYGSDHSALVVLEVWADHTEVAATYGANTDPMEFNALVARTGYRYNKAMIAVERNGVGLGVLAHLDAVGYHNVVYHTDGNPGIPKNSHDQVINAVIDDLIDRMAIRSEALKRQCLTYQNDLAVRLAQSAYILNTPGTRKRRDRHHWDLFSALAMACLGRHECPVRIRNRKRTVIPFDRTSYNAMEAYRKLVQTPPAKKHKRFGRKRRK